MSHPAFTDEDKVFIRAILTNPEELTAWLVYADWLDENDDNIRADFLRLSVRLSAPDVTQTERFGIIAQLEDLRPILDEDWVAVFDRPHIENCDERFEFQCPKKWEKLKGTEDPNVRHCDSCQKKVYYCRTKREAYDHAQQGDCVAFDTAVPHHRDDLHRDPDAPIAVRLIGLTRMPEPEPEPEPPPRPWWKFW